MILEFKCSNYKSIDDEIKLSMIATKGKEHNENLLYYNEKGVLPVISIYGCNGAGKTNVLNAIGYMHYLVSNSNSFRPGEKIPFVPHKLSKKDRSEFTIQININGTRYIYGFSNNSEEVLEEYLYHFKSNRQAKIFDRIGEEYTFGNNYKKDLLDIKNKFSRKNKLFLSTAGVNINIKDIVDVFGYIYNDLIINTTPENASWKHDSVVLMKEHNEYKEVFVNLLKAMDIGVKDINIDIKKVKFNYEDLPQDMPEDLKMLLSKNESENIDVRIDYGNLEINLNEESRGINKLFEIAIPIVNVLRNGYVLIYDELETSIHPIIVKSLIELFNNKSLNKHNAQLIFTTHDINLLDLNLLRRDQIWFAEKNDEIMSTDIYSLVELKNIRGDENIEYGYINGKYGSIPFINTDHIKKFFI